MHLTEFSKSLLKNIFWQWDGEPLAVGHKCHMIVTIFQQRIFSDQDFSLH